MTTKAVVTDGQVVAYMKRELELRARFLKGVLDPDRVLAGIQKLMEETLKAQIQGLPADHYRVPVTYAPMPSMETLKKEWGEDNVSVIFDGRPFTLHTSCVGMDRTPGERTFYVHDAGGDWESEERIAWGLKQRNVVAPNGYRPATPEETYEFAKAHPELVDFVGLGSLAVNGDNRYVADVWQNDGQRVLGSYWLGGRWARGYRVLFVAKTDKEA